MIDKVDHLGIAVRSLEESIPLYRDVLGLTLIHTETVEEQGVKVAFFQAGETTLELLEPLAPDTPVGKFIAKRGEGIHHVALGVNNIHTARERLSDGNIRLLSDAPLDGAHHKLITFAHPKDTHGVLLEVCQRKDEDHDA